jgi:peptidoglycan hydrolase CwlO-like protein
MKKYVIGVSIFLCLIVGGTFICKVYLKNNEIKNKDVDSEIQALKSTVDSVQSDLENSQLNAKSLEQNSIDELKIQLSVLDTKLSTATSDIGILENKLTIQNQLITSSKNKITSLENEISILKQPPANKVVGTWKGTRYSTAGVLQNLKYKFKEDGTVIVSIENTSTNYIYNTNMIMINNNLLQNRVMFYTLTSDNTMAIYYSYYYINSYSSYYRTDNLIKE